jgi:uncharacterized damage-inducible protein DinB
MGTSTEVTRVVDQLERAYSGDAWHGPSVIEALGDVTAQMAAARPVAAAHSIWELVLHLTSWKHEVCRRVEGALPQLPAEGDWPPVPAATEEHWAAALDDLATAHRRLIAATRLLQESHLADMVGAHRDRPLGAGVSFYVTLLGAVQHDVYHAGQLMLLKRALGG